MGFNSGFKGLTNTPSIYSILFYVEGGTGQQYSDKDMDWMTGKSQMDLL